MVREKYFRDRRSEDYNFVQFAHAFHELVDTGSFDHIYIMILAFDFHRYCEVGLVENLSGVSLQYLRATVRIRFVP